MKISLPIWWTTLISPLLAIVAAGEQQQQQPEATTNTCGSAEARAPPQILFHGSFTPIDPSLFQPVKQDIHPNPKLLLLEADEEVEKN